MPKKWTKKDFTEACEWLIEAFGDEGSDLVVYPMARDGKTGWDARIAFKLVGPFGLVMKFTGSASLSYVTNNISMWLDPVGASYPRMYATYVGDKGNLRRWINLEWRGQSQ